MVWVRTKRMMCNLLITKFADISSINIADFHLEYELRPFEKLGLGDQPTKPNVSPVHYHNRLRKGLEEGLKKAELLISLPDGSVKVAPRGEEETQDKFENVLIRIEYSTRGSVNGLQFLKTYSPTDPALLSVLIQHDLNC